MAKDIPAKTSKTAADHAQKIVEAATEATATWLKDAGKLEHAHELDLTKTFNDYDVSPDEFSKLSGTIITRVKGAKLPPNVSEHFHHAPIREFIAVLPGKPGMPSTGPLRSAYSPLAGRPQTPASGPIGKNRKPGGR